jgi:hypothetical protein
VEFLDPIADAGPQKVVSALPKVALAEGVQQNHHVDLRGFLVFDLFF